MLYSPYLGILIAIYIFSNLPYGVTSIGDLLVACQYITWAPPSVKYSICLRYSRRIVDHSSNWNTGVNKSYSRGEKIKMVPTSITLGRCFQRRTYYDFNSVRRTTRWFAYGESCMICVRPTFYVVRFTILVTRVWYSYFFSVSLRNEPYGWFWVYRMEVNCRLGIVNLKWV